MTVILYDVLLSAPSYDADDYNAGYSFSQGSSKVSGSPMNLKALLFNHVMVFLITLHVNFVQVVSKHVPKSCYQLGFVSEI